MLFEQVLVDRFIIGHPAECAAEVAHYQAADVEELIVRCQWPGLPLAAALQAIERFGREVLPRFATA